MLVKTIINGEIVVVERPDLPIEEEPFYTPEPTQEDRIEAQVMYTALMTDTLLMEDITDV